MGGAEHAATDQGPGLIPDAQKLQLGVTWPLVTQVLQVSYCKLVHCLRDTLVVVACP